MTTVPSPYNGNSGHPPGAPFHQARDSLCRTIACFLLEGLAADESALVIATAEHREWLLKQLVALSFDVARPRLGSDLFLLDADETLSELTADSALDPGRLIDLTVQAAQKVCRAGSQGFAIRIYGELAGGCRHQSTSPTKVMWYGLAASRDLMLLYDCAIGCRCRDSDVYDVWRQHSRVIPGRWGSRRG